MSWVLLHVLVCLRAGIRAAAVIRHLDKTGNGNVNWRGTAWPKRQWRSPSMLNPLTAGLTTKCSTSTSKIMEVPHYPIAIGYSSFQAQDNTSSATSPTGTDSDKASFLRPPGLHTVTSVCPLNCWACVLYPVLYFYSSLIPFNLNMHICSLLFIAHIVCIGDKQTFKSLHLKVKRVTFLEIQKRMCW